MQWKSSFSHYGSIPIAIHWLSAATILTMLASGIVLANLGDGPAKLGIVRVHVTLGLCVLVLTLLRIVWWMALDHRPADVQGPPVWQRRLSHIVHYSLYGLLLVMVSSGVALVILCGAMPVIQGAESSPLPDFTLYPPLIVHNAGAWTLSGLLLLHVGAAFFHQFWRRDRLLARMGIGHP